MTRWIVLAAVFWTPVALAAPLYSVPAPSAEQLAAAAVPASGPVRVGFGVPLRLDTRTDGAWREQGGLRIWSAELHADGARFLSLRFDLAVLPPGAALHLSGSAGGAQGPYTAADVRDGRLGTALVHGESLRLELRVPAGQAARLRLSRVNYGLRDPFSAYGFKSGDCNIDVACSAADGHQKEIDSTVLLVYPVGGGGFIACSGLLVNNARQDRTPYLLTADHCGVEAGNADEVEVYWRYQRSSCEQPGGHGHASPDPSFSAVGTQWLADDQSSDFTLLVLGSADDPFVPPADYLPFWSGWNVGGTAAQSGVGVHHPQGNEKAISFFESPARAARVMIDDREVRTWEVRWDQGTTEQGSSGSGLWNQNGRVVGVLSGGGASCSSPDEPDFYGRLNVAWQDKAACDEQLKFWLDPDDSGASSIGGSDLGDGAAQPRVPDCGGAPEPTPTPSPSPSSGGGGGSGSPGQLLILVLLMARRRRIASVTGQPRR